MPPAPGNSAKSRACIRARRVFSSATHAQVAELVDAPDSKSGSFGSAGSSPALGTSPFFPADFPAYPRLRKMVLPPLTADIRGRNFSRACAAASS